MESKELLDSEGLILSTVGQHHGSRPLPAQLGTVALIKVVMEQKKDNHTDKYRKTQIRWTMISTQTERHLTTSTSWSVSTFLYSTHREVLAGFPRSYI